jgi:MFS transporter, DHA2 family, multidrug resistance protein
VTADEARVAGRREWVGLAVLALACVVYSMDLTVLHLAVPHVSADLEPSATQLLWIVDIYGFVVAGALITMGTLGDRIGRRRLLLIGAAGFALASLLAAFSTSAEMLIASRALLGVAGATIAPSTLALIRNLFHSPAQRTFAIGVWLTAYSLGGAVGPLLGGVLLEFFWWGSVFLLALPVMALLLVLGPVLLPEFRDPEVGRPDVASAALSLASILAIVYGLKRFAQDGIGLLPFLSLSTGLMVGLVFVRRQSRLVDPLIDLRLFRVPAFAASLAVYTLGVLVLFGSFFFIYQYLQLVLERSPLTAAVWTLPSFGAFILASLLAPPIIRRIRPAYVMAAGLAIAAAGLVLLAQVEAEAGLFYLVSASVVYSIGLAPLFTVTNDLIIGAAPPGRTGAASAISETGAELGGALSIAILGTIGTAIYRSRMGDGIPTAVPDDQADTARDTLGGAVAVSSELPETLATQVVAAAQVAFTDGLRVVALVSAGMVAVAAVAVAIFLRNVQAPPASVAVGPPPRKRRREDGGGGGRARNCPPHPPAGPHGSSRS